MIEINGRKIGHGEPCYIVAEMSSNHGGELDNALEIIRLSAKAGADAVKIQLDNPDGGITIPSNKEWFKIKAGRWKGRTLFELYLETYTPWEWVPILKDEAQANRVELFASVSCKAGVDWCEKCDLPAYKISSFESNDVPLIEYVEQTGKPVIISCGFDDPDWWLTNAAYLYCVSEYPAVEIDIARMRDFDGFSDHTIGGAAIRKAISLFDVPIWEKHVCLMYSKGPDAGFSTLLHGATLVHEEMFSSMVSFIRAIEARKNQTKAFRKSIFCVQDIKQGEIFTEDNMAIIRPGYGRSPADWDLVIGSVSPKDYERGEPIE